MTYVLVNRMGSYFKAVKSVMGQPSVVSTPDIKAAKVFKFEVEARDVLTKWHGTGPASSDSPSPPDPEPPDEPAKSGRNASLARRRGDPDKSIDQTRGTSQWTARTS